MVVRREVKTAEKARRIGDAAYRVHRGDLCVDDVFDPKPKRRRHLGFCLRSGAMSVASETRRKLEGRDMRGRGHKKHGGGGRNAAIETRRRLDGRGIKDTGQPECTFHPKTRMADLEVVD